MRLARIVTLALLLKIFKDNGSSLFSGFEKMVIS